MTNSKYTSCMKTAIVSFLLILNVVQMDAQEKDTIPSAPNKKNFIIVETACGECQFGLPGKGCHLAVRIDSSAYFVDGTDIDSHGDAHADDGFCNAIRKARVQGTIVNGRFKITSFQLLPTASSK
ncbi:MAG: DUF6370 family protein [Bacteroidota bacterium]